MKFSKRALQVFRMIALGMSNREMAEELGISIKTIETHRLRLTNQIGETRTALIAVAYYKIVLGVQFPITENRRDSNEMGTNRNSAERQADQPIVQA